MEKWVYIISGVLTLAIFLIGLLTGYSFLNVQLEQLRLGMERNELELRNIQLEILFLNTLENETFCSYMNERLDTIYQNTAKIGRQLIGSEVNKEHFDLIRRRYSLALIQDWILSKQFAERCNVTRVDVLYFYDNNCNSCMQQGYILDYLVEKDQTKNIHIYTFDRDMDEPILSILVKNFNITVTPTIIINGTIYRGFRDKDFLIKKFCEIDANLTFC